MTDSVLNIFPPQAYLIGAQKAGTCTLANILAEHPAVNLARCKEAEFYNFNWNKGFRWYEQQFAPKHGASLLVDASTSYSAAPLGYGTPNMPLDGEAMRVPERMRATRADARLIYIVRNPVERMYSSYWQAVRSGQETRPIQTAVNETPDYVRPSLYYAQMQHFLQYFERERILLLNFRDLERDPAAVARTCLHFLSVDPIDFEFRNLRPRNVGFQYNPLGRALHSAAGSEHSLEKLSAPLRRFIPRPVYRALSRLVAQPLRAMDTQTREALEPLIAEDYHRFVQFTGISPT